MRPLSCIQYYQLLSVLITVAPVLDFNYFDTLLHPFYTNTIQYLTLISFGIVNPSVSCFSFPLVPAFYLNFVVITKTIILTGPTQFQNVFIFFVSTIFSTFYMFSGKTRNKANKQKDGNQPIKDNKETKINPLKLFVGSGFPSEEEAKAKNINVSIINSKILHTTNYKLNLL